MTHRTLEGGWAACPVPEICELRFHFPGVTPEEMAQVPEPILWEMCAVVDPAGFAYPENGDKTQPLARAWYEPELGSTSLLGEGRLHRDYDLPAVIYGDGSAAWFYHGRNHRDGDRPAYVSADGELNWFQHGVLHREGGPAVVEADGSAQVWLNGVRQEEPVSRWGLAVARGGVRLRAVQLQAPVWVQRLLERYA